MKFGKPMSKVEELLFYLLILLIPALAFHRFSKGHESLVYTVFMVAFYWAVITVLHLRQLRNKKSPLVEIKDGHLSYKTYFGTVNRYDLRKLKGRVEMKGAYLMAPGLVDRKDDVLDTSHLNDKIYLGYLKKKERQRFVEALSDDVRSYEPAD